MGASIRNMLNQFGNMSGNGMSGNGTPNNMLSYLMNNINNLKSFANGISAGDAEALAKQAMSNNKACQELFDNYAPVVRQLQNMLGGGK